MWRYTAPVLGYTTAAVLAVIAVTSAHYSQMRADEAALPEPANGGRAHASAPSRQYLPQLAPTTGAATPPAVPIVPPAPTTPAQAEPEPVASTSTIEDAPGTPTSRGSAPSTPAEPTSTPSSTSTPAPSETSEPTSEPTQPSEPSPSPEPTQPSEPAEPKPVLLPLVGGVVQGLTDPLLGR